MPTLHDSPCCRSPLARAGLAFAATLLLAVGRDAAAQTLLRSPVIEGGAGSAASPLDLAVADVDGDGHPDLVVASSTETRLVLGTPDGPYGSNLPFLGGTAVNACQLADFDGDGRPDLLRAPSTGGVLVQLNLGGGAFGPAQSLATTSAVSTLCLGDLDADGDLDLVVGLYGSPRITVFLGDGAGHFAPGLNEVAPLSVRRITIGDLDGDGTPDLALHNRKPAFLDNAGAYVLRGTGGGSFADPVQIGSDVVDVVIADFTGDGLPDVAVGERDGQDIGSIVVHAGNGAFSLPTAFSLPALGSEPLLAAGDLDGDGRADLVELQDTRLASRLQMPGGGLGPAIGGATATLPIPPLALADLDRDGRLDLATLRPLFGSVSAVFGNGDGTWRTQSIALPTVPAVIYRDGEVADLDADGRQDLVETYSVAGPSQLRRGGLDGSFGPPLALNLGSDVLRVLANDSTQDGKLDLVVVRTSPSSGPPGGGVALAVGDGLLGFTLHADTLPHARILEAQPADVNLDGRTDVIALETTGAEVLVNNGDGSFTSLATLLIDRTPDDAEAADIDHDGDVDLVFAYSKTIPPGFTFSSMLVYQQNAGVFTPTNSFGMTATLQDLVLSDLDGDGHVDVLGAAQSPASEGVLNIRHGAGDGSFGALQTITLTGVQSVCSLALAELDGDAEAEALVGTASSGFAGDVLVFDLVGGLPVLAETHLPGFDARRLAPVDVNGDGAQDVFVVGNVSLYTLTNTTGPWTRRGIPTAGAAGDSLLAGEGTLLPGSLLRLSIVGSKPLTATFLIVGLTELDAPFKGGVLVPTPTVLIPGLVTDANGDRSLSTHWAPGLPSGLTLLMQAWQPDAAGPAGFASTNGLRGTSP